MTRDSVDATELCGKRVTNVQLARHNPSGEIFGVWLETGPDAGYEVRGTGDAWGVVVGREPPMQGDLGPYGQVVLQDAGSDLVPTLGVVTQVAAVRGPESSRPFGLRLRFEHRRDLYIYNWGDDIKVSGRMAPVVGPVEYQDLCAPGA